MIFRLKTSKLTEEILKDLEKKTSFKPYTMVKHAISWSILQGKLNKEDFNSDSNGLELNRQTITGDYDTYFKALVESVEEIHLPEELYFPQYIKAHIDRGAAILRDRYRHAGGVDEYVLHVLGVGDTV